MIYHPLTPARLNRPFNQHWAYFPVSIYDDLVPTDGPIHGGPDPGMALSEHGNVVFVGRMTDDFKKDKYVIGHERAGPTIWRVFTEDHPPTPVWTTLTGRMYIGVRSSVVRYEDFVAYNVDPLIYFDTETDAVAVSVQTHGIGVMATLGLGLGQ